MSNKNRLPPKIVALLRGHEGVITAIHFTNETDIAIPVPSLISGSDVGEIFIWNLKTERPNCKIKAHNGKMILYLCYFKSSLISQGRDGNIHIWKYTNQEWSIIKSFTTSSYGFCAAILFPFESSTYLVAPTGDQTSLTFFDYDTSKELSSITHQTSEYMREMCICVNLFTKDKKIFLLMGYDSGHVSLWDYESNKEISRLQCHPEVILCLDFDAKHKNRGISGSVDDALQVWKKTEDDQLVKVYQVTVTHPGINAVKIRDDGKIVITAGQDGGVRMFSWKNLKPIAVLFCHKQPIFPLQWSNEPFDENNSIVFASGSKDKNICLSKLFF